MVKPQTILLVDDHSLITTAMSALLQSMYPDVQIHVGATAKEAVELAEKYGDSADLMILDLGLPGKDGLAVLKEIRFRKNHTPVLVTTARDTVNDRIEGLDAGADDYLIKPYDLDELSARIRALLRRSAGRSDPIIRRGRLTINPSTREVLFNGESVLLSSKEYALLFALAERPGIVLSRAQLEEKLYNYESLIGSNAIEVHIHHLRKKLSEDSIKTVRGVGYVLET